MKPVIGLALLVGDFILVKAAVTSFHAHQAHGAALALYVTGALASIAAWAWVLRRKPAKPAPRPYVPYGGGR